MAGTIAVYGLLLIAVLGVGINAGTYCDDIDGGSVYCDTCCDYQYGCCDTGLSTAGIFGIVIAAIVAKILFWVFCIYAIRRRRRVLLVVRETQPTSVQVSTSTVSTNPAHAGYNQPGGAIPMGPPPYAGPVVQAAPPAYDARQSYPLPK